MKFIALISSAILTVVSIADSRQFALPSNDKPLYGGAVVRLGENVPVSPDPAMAESVAEKEAASLCCPRLITIDNRGAFAKGVVQDWSWSRDRLSLTLSIRKGLNPSVGKALTAQTVSESIKRLLKANPNSAAAVVLRDIADAVEYQAGSSDNVSGLRVVDEATILITLSAPQPFLLSALADINCAPVQLDESGVLFAHGWGAFNRQSPGRFTANLDFFHGRPYLDLIIFNEDLKNPDPRWRRPVLAAVHNDQRSDSNEAVIFPGRRCVYLFATRQGNAMLGKQARLAVLHATDPETMVRIFFGDETTPLKHIVPDSAAPSYVFSTTEVDGGITSGASRLKLGYPAGNKELELVAGRIQADLVVAGFRCAVSEYRNPDFGSNDLILIEALIADVEPGYGFLQLLTRIRTFIDADTLFIKPNTDEYQWLKQTEQKLLEEGLVLPLYHAQHQVYTDKSLRGLRFCSDGTLDYENAWIAADRGDGH